MGRQEIQKYRIALLCVLLVCVLMTGCAHTYVSTLNAPDTRDVKKELVGPITEKYSGVWENRKNNEKWYLWTRGKIILNVLLEDMNGNTGDFVCLIVETDSRGDLMFMEFNLDTFLELSVAAFEFSGDQAVVQPVTTIYNIDRAGKQVVLSELRPGWVRRRAREEPEKIQFLEVEDTVLITSEPMDLVHLLRAEDDLGIAFRKFRVLEYVGELP